MTCKTCSGSGETTSVGILDCAHCTAATERAALEDVIKAAEPMTPYDERWMAYGLGKAALIGSAVEAAANRLMMAVENLGYAEGGLSGRDELEKACDLLSAELEKLKP